ncbi:MAG: hypothetical protein MAG453_01332 [Calditrichaeota bacterium]|nr:hypothetical protein [Calditrichota bacterium]
MTKRALSLLLIASLLPAAGLAQSTFTFDVPEHLIVEPEINETYAFHMTLTNTTDQERIYVLEFLTEEEELPATWIRNWCTHHYCLSPFDSVAHDTLTPGFVDTLVRVDVGAYVEDGVAILPTKVYDSALPEEAVFHTFSAYIGDVGVGEQAGSRPLSYSLAPVYPNPFNARATVRFTLPAPGEVAVSVHDVTGRRVLTLADGFHAAGAHRITLSGAQLASGRYFIRLSAPGHSFAVPATLVK